MERIGTVASCSSQYCQLGQHPSSVGWSAAQWLRTCSGDNQEDSQMRKKEAALEALVVYSHQHYSHHHHYQRTESSIA